MSVFWCEQNEHFYNESNKVSLRITIKDIPWHAMLRIESFDVYQKETKLKAKAETSKTDETRENNAMP